MRDAYQELGSAIVVQQIQDYLNSAKRMVNLSIIYLIGGNVRKEYVLLKQYEASREQYLNSRQFLLSAWCEEMTDANGQAVMEKLDEKVREYGKQRILRATKKTVSEN